MSKYYIGIDLSGTGCCSITDGKNVIEVLKYPEPIYNKDRVKEIDKEIKLIKDEPRTKTKVKSLKAERKAIKRRATRDYYKIYELLYKYKDCSNTVIIEEPLRQVSFGSTSSDTLCSSHITLGVYVSILSILKMKYKLYLPREWHELFNFRFADKMTQKERRESIKLQSIQFSKELFSNIDNFLIQKGSKKEDDNVSEACLLSILELR